MQGKILSDIGIFTFSQLPASAFRHQGQSGTAGHGLVRQCPTLLSLYALSDVFLSGNIKSGWLLLRNIHIRTV
jgi:hypothetical protein